MVSTGDYNPSPKDSPKEALKEDEFDPSIFIWIVLIFVGILLVAICCIFCCPKKKRQTSTERQASQLPSEQIQTETQAGDIRPQSQSNSVDGIMDAATDQEENELTAIARTHLNPSSSPTEGFILPEIRSRPQVPLINEHERDNMPDISSRTSSFDQFAPPPMYHELEGMASTDLPPPPSYDEFMASPNKY